MGESMRSEGGHCCSIDFGGSQRVGSWRGIVGRSRAVRGSVGVPVSTKRGTMIDGRGKSSPITRPDLSGHSNGPNSRQDSGWFGYFITTYKCRSILTGRQRDARDSSWVYLVSQPRRETAEWMHTVCIVTRIQNSNRSTVPKREKNGHVSSMK